MLGRFSQKIPPRRLYDQRHEQDDGGRDPQAERIDLHDRRERRRAPEHRKDPGETHTAYAYDRASRRNEGYAKASQITGQSLQHCQVMSLIFCEKKQRLVNVK